MAGSWIKIDGSTPEKIEIMQLGELLNIDQFSVMGRLLCVWIWIDKNSKDGKIPLLSRKKIDQLGGENFFKNLQKINWIIEKKDHLFIPNFNRYFGECDKRRTLQREKQQRYRRKKSNKKVDDKKGSMSTSMSTVTSTTMSTDREEKRREEKRREDKDLKQDQEISLFSDENKDRLAVDEVFEFWVVTLDKDMNRTRLTASRKNKIESRLGDGFSVEEIKTAIKNISRSEFHNGKNENNTLYNDLTLICRSKDKLNYFINDVGQAPNNNNFKEKTNGYYEDQDEDI